MITIAFIANATTVQFVDRTILHDMQHIVSVSPQALNSHDDRPHFFRQDAQRPWRVLNRICVIRVRLRLGLVRGEMSKWANVPHSMATVRCSKRAVSDGWVCGTVASRNQVGPAMNCPTGPLASYCVNRPSDGPR